MAQWKRVGCEPTDREKEERRAKDAEGEEPEGMATGLRYRTARHQLKDPIGHRGRGPVTGRATVPSWATPKETWRAGYVVFRSRTGTG